MRLVPPSAVVSFALVLSAGACSKERIFDRVDDNSGGSNMPGGDGKFGGEGGMRMDETSLCPFGKFTENDGDTCATWRKCGPGSFIETPGSDTTDQGCAPCEDKTFSDSTDLFECKPWSSCDEWQTLAAPGTRTSDVACVHKPWQRQVGTSGEDNATSLIVDERGDVYVVGFTFGGFTADGNHGGADAFLMKLSGRDGSTVWVEQYGSDQADSFYDVAMASNGDIFVVGHTSGALKDGFFATGNYDVYVARLSSEDGTVIWDQQLDLGAGEFGFACEVDSFGDVVAVGQMVTETNATESDDAWISKFDAETGAPSMTTPFGTDDDDVAFSLAIDPSGDYLVGGWTSGDLDGETNPSAITSVDSGFVRKMKANTGVHEWTTLIGTSERDAVHDVVVDSDGNAYVAGFTAGNFGGDGLQGDQDMMLARLAGTTGKIVWGIQLGGPEVDRANALALTKNGLTVAGYSTSNWTGNPLPTLEDGLFFQTSFDGKSPQPGLISTESEDKIDAIHFDDRDDRGATFFLGETAGVVGGEMNFGSVDLMVFKVVH